MKLQAQLLAMLAMLLVVAFTAFGLAQYDALRRAILSEVDRTLLVRAQSLVREVQFLGGDRLDPAHLDELHLAEPLESAQAPEIFAQIFNAEGQVVAASDNLDRLTLPLPAGSGTRFYDHTLARGQPLRLMAAPVLTGDRPIGVVVVGQSLGLASQSMGQAVWRMVAVGAVALLVTLLLSGLLVSWGLTPLKRMADTAAEIVDTGDVSRRVPLTGPVNEISKVAESFNAVVARVEQQLEAQRRLLADTSHELGNPLTVLRTDLSLLAHDLDPETRAETVAEADKEAERMGRLLDELLQLSAVGVDAPPPPDDPVKLDNLAEDVVTRLRPLAGSRSLRLEAPTPLCVRGSADQLGQVLSNLLENAIRHTAADGEIVVKVVREGGRVRVSVADNGIGISAEHLPHIFERFYRVDRARSRASGGAGLGLAIARMIAQRHGGTLTAQSIPEKGSTFTMELPETH